MQGNCVAIECIHAHALRGAVSKLVDEMELVSAIKSRLVGIDTTDMTPAEFQIWSLIEKHTSKP